MRAELRRHSSNNVSLFLALLTVFAVTLPAHAASSPLRVLTYNVWGLPWPAQHATWRYKEIAKRLSSYDVIALEEMWSRKTKVLWKNNLKTHPYRAKGGNPHGFLGASGLIAMSRYPIVERHFEKFQACAEIECIEHKGVLMFRIRMKSGDELDFYMTHTNAWEKHSLVRTSQILQIIGMVERYSIGRPVIVLGDLNFDFKSDNYWELKAGLTLNDSYEEYVDRLPDASPDQLNGYTFDINANPWAAPKYSHENRPQRLDYIFYRPTARVRLNVRESSLAMTQSLRNDKPGSDHYGVTTLFDVEH